MHADDNDRTQCDPAAEWVDMWWITPTATAADITVITDTARATRTRLVAHPATLEQAGRTASPFGPIARSATLTAGVLAVPVTADPAIPEGLIITVPDHAPNYTR